LRDQSKDVSAHDNLPLMGKTIKEGTLIINAGIINKNFPVDSILLESPDLSPGSTSTFPSVDNLLKFVRTSRPIARPNDGFIANLREYRDAWDRTRKHIGDPNGVNSAKTT
jgi:hypothetical protein